MTTLGLLLLTPVLSGQEQAWPPVPMEIAPGVVRLPPVEAWPVWADTVSPGVPGPTLQASSVAPISEDGLPPIQALPQGRLAPVPLIEDELPPIKLWQGSVELGLNGASGNNESFNFHFAANAQRRTALNAFTFKLDYFRQTQQNQNIADRLFNDWRLEHFFPASPWTCYVHGTFEYDPFAAYNSRVMTDAGVGYRFFETDKTSLIVRCGAGVAREFGGPNNEFTPEAVFGLDFQHRLGIRHRLVGIIEYIPEITDFGHYRINTQAAWEYLLDQGLNLSLKLGALDRYNSMPYGKEPNDLNYGAVLLWKF
jgi:putative salt-induced outer membrane protein YdiY